MVCAFFGHKDCAEEIEEKAEELIISLIRNEEAVEFLVGNNGNFDKKIQVVLRKIKNVYPHINYAVALAYLPEKKTLSTDMNTVFPEILDNVPPKYAIDRRNTWMIDKADIVITYVRHISGGAAKFREKAKKKGKIVMDI